MMPKLRAAVAPLTAVIAIALAALVWHHLPENSQIYAPFDVRSDTGSPAQGRALTTTVTGLRIAPLIKPALGRQVHAIGVWVIVDATMSATLSTGLPRAELPARPGHRRGRHRPVAPPGAIPGQRTPRR